MRDHGDEDHPLDKWERQADDFKRDFKRRADEYRRLKGSAKVYQVTYFINVFHDHNEPIKTKDEHIADMLYLMFIERGWNPVMYKEGKWVDA